MTRQSHPKNNQPSATSTPKTVNKTPSAKITKEAIHEAKPETVHDSLLACLVIITQLKQCPYSAEALQAGLPLENNCLTPALFPRAAERAGLHTRLVNKPLTEISPLILPVVLLLKDKGACILQRYHKDGTATVIMPEMDKQASVRVKLVELAQEYTGYTFFIQPIHAFETRTKKGLEEKPKSWFWGTLWRFKHIYYQVALSSLFINSFALVMPLFIMNVYDRVIPNNALETLWVLAIGTTIVFLFDFLIKSLRGFFIDTAGKKADILLASSLFSQMMGIKMSVRPPSAGVQANHMREFEGLRDFFTSATLSTVVDLPFILLFLLIIWLIGGSIVIVHLATIPLIIITSFLISGPLSHYVANAFMGGSQKHAILVESLNNLEVIKSVAAEGLMQTRWEKSVGYAAEASLRTRFFSLLASNVTTFLHHLTTVLVVIMGVYLVADKSIDFTIGALIACVILTGRAMAPLTQMTNLFTRYYMARQSYQVLDEMMKLPIERPIAHKFLHRPKIDGAIEFDNVTFHYPEQKIDLYRGLTFRIAPGEKVAILGEMGVGKSTLHKLIMNFYSPVSGAIRIDGTDINQIDPVDLRHHIGYVPQENRLFFGTVRDNIAFKAPWIEDHEVLTVAKVVGADDFISRHPSGYDMPIEEGGGGLSGGQAQSICIARSLLLSPQILLFDEPTSAMDSLTEKKFLLNMQHYLQDKTLLLVTHKAALLTLVDRIIVIQQGKVMIDGPREEVLKALNTLNQQGAHTND